MTRTAWNSEIILLTQLWLPAYLLGHFHLKFLVGKRWQIWKYTLRAFGGFSGYKKSSVVSLRQLLAQGDVDHSAMKHVKKHNTLNSKQNSLQICKCVLRYVKDLFLGEWVAPSLWSLTYFELCVTGKCWRWWAEDRAEFSSTSWLEAIVHRPCYWRAKGG